MRIVNSIAERDAIRPAPVLCESLGDGSWKCYETGDTLPVYPEPTPTNIISVSDFRGRFTTAELQAVTTLAYGGDANVQLLLLKLQTNTDGVDLLSAEVIGGVGYLVSKGALTSTRKTEILA